MNHASGWTPRTDILFIDGDHTHPAGYSDLYSYAPMERGRNDLDDDIVPPANVTTQMIQEGWDRRRERRFTTSFLTGNGLQLTVS